MAISMAARRRIIALSRGAITIKQYRAAEAKAKEAKVAAPPSPVPRPVTKPAPEPIVAKEAVSPLFEQPYARIQREALIIPAPPVRREVERVVKPRPPVWEARKAPPAKYITRPEEIPRLIQETRFAEGKPTELATTPLGFLPRETQMKLLRARESYFEGMKKWSKKIEEEVWKVPYAAPALAVGVAAVREVTVGIPEMIVKPGEVVAGLKEVVKEPRMAAYALGEELATERGAARVTGEFLAWYGIPKIPKDEQSRGHILR